MASFAAPWLAPWLAVSFATTPAVGDPMARWVAPAASHQVTSRQGPPDPSAGPSSEPGGTGDAPTPDEAPAPDGGAPGAGDTGPPEGSPPGDASPPDGAPPESAPPETPPPETPPPDGVSDPAGPEGAGPAEPAPDESPDATPVGDAPEEGGVVADPPPEDTAPSTADPEGPAPDPAPAGEGGQGSQVDPVDPDEDVEDLDQDLDGDLDEDLDQDLDQDLDEGPLDPAFEGVDGDEGFGMDDDYDPIRDSPEGVVATRWVNTGIGLIATGGALGIGAIILGASDPCTRRAGNSCQAEARNRAALTMGLPALAIVGGGVAALVVGRRQRKALAANVAFGPRGIVVSGRF